MRPLASLLVICGFIACVLTPQPASAQTLYGTLSGTVKDESGGVLKGATVRVTSPDLIGGERKTTTDDRGAFRVMALPSGSYTLTVELLPKFKQYKAEEILIGAGATIDRQVALQLAGVATDVAVTATPGENRNSGLTTRIRSDYLEAIPSRRVSMFDPLKATPGVSPTSASSGTVNTLSVFGSGVNENMFLIDGTNFTCPCQGVSRAEPSADVIKEMQVQTTGADVEYGNIQGAIFNVVTKQGSARYELDASYYGQPSSWTAQPVLATAPNGVKTGFERVKYHDFTTNGGGPILPDRMWFFAGYQYLRDYDSQPGADPAFPRKYEQNKFFGKVTWKPTKSMQIMHAFNFEKWVNPTVPTPVVPFIATQRVHATVPSMTFVNITHVVSNKTMWEARAGRFLLPQDIDPSSGDFTTPPHVDSNTNVQSVNTSNIGSVRFDRITGKALVHRYEDGWLGANHHFKLGTQIERGQHRATNTFPGGVQYIDRSGAPFQRLSRDPYNLGGRFNTFGVFASDSVALNPRVTAELGLRFDHSQAISQDLKGVDAHGKETDGFTPGLGDLYTWNVFSPRLGVTAKLDSTGRTALRANYGRFNQGVLTGELDPIHPGVSTITRMEYEAATGDYTKFVSTVDPNKNLDIDRNTRAPHTDEFSIALDHQISSLLVASAAYISKSGRDFIGWTDTGGTYAQDTYRLPDGTDLPIYRLTNGTGSRLFYLTNPDGRGDLFLDYNGFVVALQKRLSRSWQAAGSYTYSRTYGRQVASNAPSAEAQFSTIARPNSLTFGQDPNDWTNSEGRLPNDRPHVFRTNGVAILPWYGITVAGNLQVFSGRPWMATAQVPLPQSGQQRIMIEPRGSRRLPTQSLFDLRISKTVRVKNAGTVDLRLDVLNLLNDSAAESVANDVLYTAAGTTPANFGVPATFMDPRRVMLSVRMNLGR